MSILVLCCVYNSTLAQEHESGQNLRLAAAWFGNPIPEIVWRKDGVRIAVADGYSFANEQAPMAAGLGRFERQEQPESGTAILEFSGVRRANEGKYELTLTNSQGSVTSACNVKVT
ncbi:hypothetical protein T265_16180, partial [Opisthorchis viverrini]